MLRETALIKSGRRSSGTPRWSRSSWPAGCSRRSWIGSVRLRARPQRDDGGPVAGAVSRGREGDGAPGARQGRKCRRLGLMGVARRDGEGSIRSQNSWRLDGAVRACSNRVSGDTERVHRAWTRSSGKWVNALKLWYVVLIYCPFILVRLKPRSNERCVEMMGRVRTKATLREKGRSNHRGGTGKQRNVIVRLRSSHSEEPNYWT